MTRTQQQILAFIRLRLDAAGVPPTQHEIREHMGWKAVRAAQYHLERLEEAGHITRHKGKARWIELGRVVP